MFTINIFFQETEDEEFITSFECPIIPFNVGDKFHLRQANQIVQNDTLLRSRWNNEEVKIISKNVTVLFEKQHKTNNEIDYFIEPINKQK